MVHPNFQFKMRHKCASQKYWETDILVLMEYFFLFSFFFFFLFLLLASCVATPTSQNPHGVLFVAWKNMFVFIEAYLSSVNSLLFCAMVSPAKSVIRNNSCDQSSFIFWTIIILISTFSLLSLLLLVHTSPSLIVFNCLILFQSYGWWGVLLHTSHWSALYKLIQTLLLLGKRYLHVYLLVSYNLNGVCCRFHTHWLAEVLNEWTKRTTTKFHLNVKNKRWFLKYIVCKGGSGL